MKKQAMIVGVGMTEQGRFPDETPWSLAAGAIRRALDDAGLKKNDLDGLAIRKLDPIGAEWQQLAEVLNINARFGITVTYGGASATAAIGLAASAVEQGLAECVACVYASGNRSAERKFDRQDDFTAPFGFFSQGARLALAMQRHMAQYGSKPEQLAPIAVAARKHATLNPAAILREKPLTTEDYLNANLICWPLRRPDYCMVSDGAGCVIVTTAERARDCAKQPVYVRAYESAHSFRPYEDPELWLQRGPEQQVAARIYQKAGIDRSDINALYVYDSFSVMTWLALENYGFCPMGEVGDFIADGRIEIGGALPVNTHGGHLAESYIGGILHYVEAVRQLRGQVGPRQVQGAEIVQGVAIGSGGRHAASIILSK